MLNWIVWNRTEYLYKMDLALNNLQRLIHHKIQSTNQATTKDKGTSSPSAFEMFWPFKIMNKINKFHIR